MTSFIARTPVDLLAVVPYAIGFHPDDSVVLLTFGGGAGPRSESFHARVDLPVVATEQAEVAAMLEEVVLRRRCRQVGLLLYTEDVGAAHAFHDLLVPRLQRAGVEVVDALRVAGDRFHTADDPDDPGTPYDLTAHPFTASQVVQGRVAHDSREALADTLVGADEDDRAAISVAADAFADRLLAIGLRAPRGRTGARRSLTAALSAELRDQGRWLQHEVRRAVRDPGAAPLPASGPTASDAGRLLVLVALDSLREVVLAEMTRGTAAGHVELWRRLCSRAPRDLRPAPAALCAFAAWLHGEGALGWCALERCFEVDPDDALGHHVAALLESATPPSVWAPIPQHALRVFAPGPDATEKLSSSG